MTREEILAECGHILIDSRDDAVELIEMFLAKQRAQLEQEQLLTMDSVEKTYRERERTVAATGIAMALHFLGINEVSILPGTDYFKDRAIHVDALPGGGARYYFKEEHNVSQ